MNQEVLVYQCAFISFAKLDWPNMLPSEQLAINNHDSSVSGLSPFFLVHGYHIELILQVLLREKTPISASKGCVDRFINRLEAQEYTAAAMASAQQFMEDKANNTHNTSPLFHEGGKVLLNLKNITIPRPKKLT